MDRHNPGDRSPPVPGGHGARYGAHVMDRLEDLRAQLRAAIPGAADEAVQEHRRLLTPEPDGAGPSDVTALNNANRKLQRIRQGFEIAAATQQAAEAMMRPDVAWVMRPVAERGAVPPRVADRRAAALAAALMRERPPGGAAAAVAAMHDAGHVPDQALQMMAAAVAAEVDWADELEEEALLREAVGRGPAKPRGVDCAHRDMRARLEMQAPMPGGNWRHAVAAEHLRLRPYGEQDVPPPPPPRMVARPPPPRPPADAAAGGAAAVAEHDSAVAGGTIKCPICGVALPLHLSNDAVNAHLDQCLG